MIRVTTNYFCAAVVLRNGVVISAAPILRYMKGWAEQKVMEYARKKWRGCLIEKL